MRKISMKNYIVVSSDDELRFNWYDDKVPNMCGCFIETSLEQCTISENGEYLASYEPYVVSEVTEITYLKNIKEDTAVRGSNETTFVLQPGIYLLHPNDI